MAKSSFWKDCILTQDRPSQDWSPLPHVRSRQLPGSIFFADLSSLLVVSSDSYYGVGSVCVPHSDSPIPHPSLVTVSLAPWLLQSNLHGDMGTKKASATSKPSPNRPLLTKSGAILIFDSSTLVHVQDDRGDSLFHDFTSHRPLMTHLEGTVGHHRHYPSQETSGILFPR